MAKLYFRYAAMNAGKSTSLLQVAHNYEERDQSVRVFTSAIDTRQGDGRIASRLGVSRAAALYDTTTDFAAVLLAQPLPSCVLIDEAQFLTELQVTDLHRFAHVEGVPASVTGCAATSGARPFPAQALC